MAISTSLRNSLIDHFHGKTSYTMPSCYMGLWTTLPAIPAMTGGTECTGGSYARQDVHSSWAAAASGAGASNATITFAGMPSCTVVGWGLFDAVTAGNVQESHVIEQTATAEVVTLSSGLGVTANANISTVTVKNNTDVTTYVEGTDYYVQYDGGVIVRIASGAITASQVLHITYNYAITRTVSSGDSFSFSSGNVTSTFKGYN